MAGRVGHAVLLALVLLLAPAPGAAAQQQLVAVPGGTADGRARLIVQVPDGSTGAIPPEAFSASLDGVRQPVEAVPVLSDELAMALVVDASADESPALAAGLSGAANFLLAAPASTRTTLVTDGTRPTVTVPWPSGPEEVLRGLAAVRPGGDRSTAAALAQAVAQLPAEASGPRLVVLVTGASDAGSEQAPAIVDRLRSAGVVLAVVSTTGPATPVFWTDVATATGGVAVGSGPARIIPAFDQITAALGRRYLLTVPTPAQLPATLALRLETGGGAVLGAVTVPPVPPALGGRRPLFALGGVAVAAVMVCVGILLLRRGVRRDTGPSDRATAPRMAWRVPPPIEAPVERAAVLADLTARLRREKRAWLRPHPDIAGLGITSVMIDFAHRNRSSYDVAWWIPALDADLVPDRMVELAEALGLATVADPVDETIAALLEDLSRRRRWLLVFDDAASPCGLARYVPSGPGDVVIASSDPRWREFAGPVTVPTFTRHESVSLLRSTRPDLPREPADRLAAALGDLPLAVGPVAPLLADTDTVGTVLPGGPGDPAEMAWAAAVDRLAVDEPEALALLTLAAWLGPAPVPLSLLVEHPDVLPEPLTAAARAATLARHAASLGRRRLAQASAEEIQVHTVAAELLTGRSDREHSSDGGWTAIAVRLLRAAAPDSSATAPQTWRTWRLLLPHVLAATDPARRLDAVAGDVAWLLAEAGNYLAARGRAHAARALLEDAHEYDVRVRLRSAAASRDQVRR